MDDENVCVKQAVLEGLLPVLSASTHAHERKAEWQNIRGISND